MQPRPERHKASARRGGATAAEKGHDVSRGDIFFGDHSISDTCGETLRKKTQRLADAAFMPKPAQMKVIKQAFMPKPAQMKVL